MQELEEPMGEDERAHTEFGGRRVLGTGGKCDGAQSDGHRG